MAFPLVTLRGPDWPAVFSRALASSTACAILTFTSALALSVHGGSFWPRPRSRRPCSLAWAVVSHR